MKERTIMIGRREFTAAGVMALLSGVTVTIWGCGSSSTPSSPSSTGGSSSGATADLSGTISSNHGHSAVIKAADLTAKNSVTLDIRGSAAHTHSVELSASEVGSAAAGQRVSKVSSTDASAAFGTHSHTVTFN
jgi:hypothetical protein